MLHRNVETVCVGGLNSMISVLPPPVDQCFANCDTNTHGWANFFSCNSIEEISNLRALQTRDGNGENVLRMKALIPIPLKIITNLAEILTTTKEPHAVLLQLIQVYHNFDDQTPSNAAKSSILKLLWAKDSPDNSICTSTTCTRRPLLYHLSQLPKSTHPTSSATSTE